MKYFFFSLFLIIFSCKKQDDLNQSLDLNKLINKNFSIESWRHQDFTTGEFYDLLDNREIDSIIICFSSSKFVVAKIEFTEGNEIGLNTDVWSIIFSEKQYYFKKDEYTYFKLVNLNDEMMIWEGEHKLHQQKQRITISLKKINENSQLLDYLNQRFL